MGLTSVNAVVDQGAAVVIMVMTNRRAGVDVVVLVGAEEEGLEAEMTEGVVVTSGGCRTLDGVDGVGGVVVLRRRRRPGGGMSRLIGGDHLFIWSLFVTQWFIYAYMFSFAELALDHSRN